MFGGEAEGESLVLVELAVDLVSWRSEGTELEGLTSENTEHPKGKEQED